MLNCHQIIVLCVCGMCKRALSLNCSVYRLSTVHLFVVVVSAAAAASADVVCLFIYFFVCLFVFLSSSTSMNAIILTFSFFVLFCLKKCEGTSCGSYF